jgi:hypothetical protein
MATIQMAKIYSVANVNPGETHRTNWNNPPWSTALAFFAYPVPAAAHGPHGTSSGEVEITGVSCHWLRDNYNGDKQYVTIAVKNTGASATAFHVYQSWIV